MELVGICGHRNRERLNLLTETISPAIPTIALRVFGPGDIANIRFKMYPGTMNECLESYFDDNIDARNGKYIYPDQLSALPITLA